MDLDRLWRSLAADACGSVAHSGLMLLKSSIGLLPAFHPYADLQRELSVLVGSCVSPIIPWALSFLNGSLVLEMLFRAQRDPTRRAAECSADVPFAEPHAGNGTAAVPERRSARRSTSVRS